MPSPKYLIIPVLLFALISLIPIAAAQIGDTQDCPDYCDSKLSILYLKGYWNEKLRECVYAYEEPCKYGCEDDARISSKPACKDFPDEPPENQTELDSTTWEMLKKLYDKDKLNYKISVHGTEYQIGDSAKAFIQLLDSTNQPITNSTCFISAYYPNVSLFFDGEAMTYADEGLYYYNTIPNITGVYMLSAYCYVPSTVTDDVANDDVECNGYGCGSGWEANWSRNSDAYWFPQSSERYLGDYAFELNNDAIANRSFNASGYDSIKVEFYTSCKQLGFDEEYYFSVCDTSDVCYRRLSITEDLCDLFLAHPSWGFFSYTFSNDSFDMDGVITLKIDTSGNLESVDGGYFDNFQVWGYRFQNESEYQIVRGSGELHVSNINTIINQTFIAESIWNYPLRNLTWYNFSEIISYLQSINSSVTSLHSKCDQMNVTLQQIRDFQVNELSANLSEILLNLEYINTTANRTYTYMQGLVNLSAPEVWSYYNRTLTDYNQSYLISLIMGLENLTASDVWSYSIRNLTYYPSFNDTAILNAIQSMNNSVIGEISSAETNILNRIDAHNASIWNKLYSIQSELAYINTSIHNLNNLSAFEVWNYTERELTFYPDPINYSLIQEMVWNASNRSLTQFDFIVDINGTAILTAIYETNQSIMEAINNLHNLTEQDVWSYFNRTLTFYPSQQDLTDYQYIQEMVWNRTDRNLTYYEDIVDYLYIQGLVWNSTNRTLTYYPTQQDLTDYLYIQSLVWNATNRNLTYYQDVTDYLYIQAMTWNNTNRTLTDFDFTVEINDTNIINFLTGANTSIMNKLNVVNATTFATYLLLLNLTLGNVSVTADVDWHEGELVLYNVSSEVQAFSNVVKMQAENIQLVTTTDVCVDGNTLEHRVNATNCIGQYCYDYNFTTTEVCHYGCKNNMCVPPPWYAIIIAMIVALIIAGTIYWFTRKEGLEP